MNPDDSQLGVGDKANVAPSVPELILNAPLGVQLAIIVLLVALMWSVVVIARKLIQLYKARKEADKFEKVFWSGQALDELYQPLAQRRNNGM
ncbi:MAG: protein TolQ, partial [Methyloceanibacter sp.]